MNIAGYQNVLEKTDQLDSQYKRHGGNGLFVNMSKIQVGCLIEVLWHSSLAEHSQDPFFTVGSEFVPKLINHRSL